MGRIKKAAGPKHEATVSSAIAEFVAAAAVLPLPQLPQYLRSFPRRWPFPRGDLYHWITLLNRFDLILEHFGREYGLQDGPQTKPFTRSLLERGISEGSKSGTNTRTSPEELDNLGFAQDGDKYLVTEILTFSRELMDRCGNRSLYSSSDRLADLLNTTDLSLLSDALQLAVRLAQRYHASRQRGANASQSLNNALLASHYNIDLEKVQKLANPFSKPLPSRTASSSTQSNTPLIKAREKRRTSASASFNNTRPSDLLAMAVDEVAVANGSASKSSMAQKESLSSRWDDWGAIQLRYYHSPSLSSAQDDGQEAISITPTPARRLSRPSRLSGSDESFETSKIPPAGKAEDHMGMKVMDIPHHKVTSTPVTELLRDSLSELPKQVHYDFLTKCRIARAMSATLSTRRDLLNIRLLALTNLAYIYPEQTFQQKILQQDSDEPRRLQLAYQLADLIHSPGSAQAGIPLSLQATALGTLEALTKHKSRASDVCAALNINVNHGVLLHTLRKVAAGMAINDTNDEDLAADDWREALFSLLDALPISSARTGETLISAGLFDILIEILTARSDRAERYFPKVLTFLNTIVYTVRDALQTLANAKGLIAISDLIAYEVQCSLQSARDGQGMPAGYRVQSTDHQIPYFQQQTLRWLFKFVNHMMSHGGGNVDRLLRNLIDSPQLLGGLRVVIVNAKIFGSNVWSGAVNILSSFIHNEPTSYGIIAEAGLSKGFLQSISSELITDPGATGSRDTHATTSADLTSEDVESSTNSITSVHQISPGIIDSLSLEERKDGLIDSILPATDAIVTIPQAFGAICLNNAGMELFRRSKALERFFEIFESSEHVKSLTAEGELARLLGSSFDELVRHHPQLKPPVMMAVLVMVSRLTKFCKSRAANGHGTKLWVNSDSGDLEAAGGQSALRGDIPDLTSAELTSDQEGDVLMGEASALSQHQVELQPSRFETTEKSVKPEEPTSTYINAAMKFLAGFFENTNLCSAFVEASGVERVLDIAELPSLEYDFNNHAASQEIARVVHMLVEQKPHLVVPSIIKRTQAAADVIEPLCNHVDGSAYFAKYTTPNTIISPDENSSQNGTRIVKSLVVVHTFCSILYETFSPPLYNTRSNHTIFTQVNLSDMYVKLVRSLGRLHQVCVWEEILLQKSMPESWKEATKVKGYGMGSQEADDVFGLITRDEVTPEPEETMNGLSPNDQEDTEPSTSGSRSSSSKKRRQSSLRRDENSAQFMNVRTLRYLLSQLPSSIVPFFQGLGKALIAKRRSESYARQNAYMVAEAMSTSVLEQLRFEAPKNTISTKDRYSYWIVILTSLSQLMIEGGLENPHPQCLTLVLQTFKNGCGLDVIKELLETFFNEVKALPNPSSNPTPESDMSDVAARLAAAYGGIKIILNFYTQIVSSKTILESTQTISMSSSDRDRDRDRGQAHFFFPPQFLVELRMTVLPVVRSIWDSDFVEKAPSSIIKCLIEILRVGLESNDELGAYKRGDKLPIRAKHTFKTFHIHEDKLKVLTDQGYHAELAREALYRCYNSLGSAEDYCLARKKDSRVPRNAVPDYDVEKPASLSTGSSQQSETSDTTTPDLERIVQSEDRPVSAAIESESEAQAMSVSEIIASTEASSGSSSIPPPPAPGVPESNTLGSLMDATLGNMTDITDITGGDLLTPRQPSGSDQTTPSASQANLVSTTGSSELVTVEDLDEVRSRIRQNLIDRALDVLNVHDDITFELADLINAATVKSPDSMTMRREIGETLLQSLISFQIEDDFRTSGKKIAAYANLLGLVLQDDEFYQATLDELKSNFVQLLGFIKIFPDQKSEETSSWIGQILLILEKVLAEDVQPSKIQWTNPDPESVSFDIPLVVLEGPTLATEVKLQLFETLVEIMPRIGKDETLALAIVRVLVILTRNERIAQALVEKKNIQRLFLMIKQLAGITNERLQSSFMLVIRHIVEDEDTIRQIMRSEIVHAFETRTPRNPTDTTGYVRQMYHLVLRSPEIFVEVTNEMLEIKSYDPGPRPQTLSLKPGPEEKASKDGTAQLEQAKRNNQTDSMETTESNGKASLEDNQSSQQKLKTPEVKSLVVDHPSGVMHYILCELLSYKDVQEKEIGPPLRKSSESQNSLGENSSAAVVPMPRNAESQGLWLLAEAATSENVSGSVSSDSNSTKKVEKVEFRPEQHPIHIYRCFLLQCLTELLNSYNRTKIEFISFSRKADPQALTPSKPRSGVLNYLLTDLVPVGTLSHEETISARKRSTLSDWAMSTVVALCLMTNENGYDKKKNAPEDEEPELLFVRRFVLEHALKAYKDATASDETLDVKYARLLCLADLFERLLQGKLGHVSANPPSVINTGSQKQLAKVMFEKNFISALTSSISDIDLNFPQSRRAIKYILKPLKELTSTAIALSESSSISSFPGQSDEDEISTASSVSDIGDEREETPDLFRNSTLGMFEPGREEESSSETSDDEEGMYVDDYDEGMEFDDEIERDGEVISDEDEELEGVGHMEGMPGDNDMDVEVVIDGDEEDSSGDDDDEDEDQDDSEDMDDDDVLGAIDEITGDDNHSLGGDEEEWQDEADGEDQDEYGEVENDMGPQVETEDADGTSGVVQELMREFGGNGEALNVLQGNRSLEPHVAQDDYPDDAGMQAGEEDMEEEEDDGEDEELVYQPDYADDEPNMPDPPWGWDPDDDAGGMPPPRHHHHHPRRIVSPWTIFPAGHPGDRAPIYRSHRPSGTNRAPDDGTNPLLQRDGRSSGPSNSDRSVHSRLSDAAASMSDFWVHGMEPGPQLRGGPISAESPVSFVNNIIAAISQHGSGGFATVGGQPSAVHLHIGGPAGGRGLIPRELQALLGLRGPPQELARPQRNASAQATTFLPLATSVRWQEEARLLFGNAHAEKAQRVIHSLLRILIPPAMEQKKRRDEEERLEMEARAKAAEEERRVKEEREKAEKEAQDKKEQEEREAAAAVDAERLALAAADDEKELDNQGAEENGGAMEGVETTHAQQPASAAQENADISTSAEASTEVGPSVPSQRVRTTFRGHDLDITGMGVDLEYLEALPEDLREEVLVHQIAVQRSQAVSSGEEPTDISREFLEALPPEIRQELLEQEAQDRRRREREEERRRRTAESGAPPRAEEMDPASFLASLDPTLRQAVLMEQDEEVLSHLPTAIAAEARALGSDRVFGTHRGFAGMPGHPRSRIQHDREHREAQQPRQKPPHRQIVQMLDTAGVATLLRLMFVQIQGTSRISLNGILHDVSRNRQTRAEVVSFLLSILQDGSTDVPAVERSFAHLSLRAKQSSTAHKSPLPLKRSSTGSMISLSNSEMTPLMVIQQCLNALVFLAHYNPHIPSFFLTEHEISPGLKSKSSRKGKGKETKSQKFALNALLSLLDRKLIMESSSCMEQLSTLLQAITHPLTMLLRKDKEKPEESPKVTEETQPTNAPMITANEVGTNQSEAQLVDRPVENLSNAPDAAIEAPPVDGSLILDPASIHTPPLPDSKPDDDKKSEESKNRKQRTLTPPVVPEENLRLVVNILAARECSAKTFRETLSTINNLSIIPETRDVFGKGLIEQAQALGQSIVHDLDDLVFQIQEAEPGTDVQGMALAKFSPASSDQAKLLRSLTALDYLFDPKRSNPSAKVTPEDKVQGKASSTPDEDLLTTLYENPIFIALWTTLSECLSALRQAEGTLNVATILLPLIEALMVVCKNTTLKDTLLIKTAKEASITSPSSESRMESLFFRFTEDHRKILNDLVRHNPKLMSGTFSLLVKNPKVLEFDNKRNYFNRRLHSRGSEIRNPQGPLQLNIRRDQVFLDSYKALHFKSGDEIKFGKLNIRFQGEEGVDAGGVTREWFQVLSRQMFNPDYALFVPVASDRTTFHPNKASKINEEHLDFFKFIGRIIGKALYEGRALDCHFSRAVYKRILGKSVSIKDMETLDLEYYKSQVWMLENDIGYDSSIIADSFSIETENFGVTEIVDLVEGGRNIPVTEGNKHEYVQLVVEHRLVGSVQAQLEKFLQGFHDVVPAELVSIFNEQELELLISGLPDIDVDDWKNNSDYHNYVASSPQIQWFWRAVRSFDKEERAKLLQFVTGTSKVPLNGFSQLEGMNGFSRFNIHRDYGNKDRLPSSHTCFNQLDLPEYDSYEQLRRQLYTAMTAGSEYFGFA